MRIAVQMALIAFLCGAFPSAAHAVKLADGEAVGHLLGYAAMCCKKINFKPQSTSNDRLLGEKYAVWVKKNTRNPMQTMTDFQMGLNLGMAAAAQNDYANCAHALSELIGFYEYFGQSGDAYIPALQKYKKTTSSNSVSPQSNVKKSELCIQKVIGTFTSDAIYLGYEEAEGMGSANFQINGEYMYMNATEEEIIKYFNDKPGAKVRVTYETTQGPFEGKCLQWHELKGGHLAEIKSNMTIDALFEKTKSVQFKTCTGSGNTVEQKCWKNGEVDGTPFFSNKDITILTAEGYGNDEGIDMPSSFSWIKEDATHIGIKNEVGYLTYELRTSQGHVYMILDMDFVSILQ